MSLRKVLVTDTNIWIDLDNGGILKEVFLLPYQFLTPDLAVPELKFPSWETLHAFGLESQGLDSASMQDLFMIRQVHKSLSVVDLASYLLAKASALSLVTGDRHLSDFAQSQGLKLGDCILHMGLYNRIIQSGFICFYKFGQQKVLASQFWR